MSRAQRLGFIGVAVAIAVAAILLIGFGGDETDDAPTTPASDQPRGRAPSTGGAPVAPAGSSTDAAVRDRTTLAVIEVEDGKPVGSVERVSVKKGRELRLEVESADTTDEVHVHGYDLTKELRPGRPARFRFKVDLDGIFEVELHGSEEQIAKLVVRP